MRRKCNQHENTHHVNDSLDWSIKQYITIGAKRYNRYQTEHTRLGEMEPILQDGPPPRNSPKRPPRSLLKSIKAPPYPLWYLSTHWVSCCAKYSNIFLPKSDDSKRRILVPPQVSKYESKLALQVGKYIHTCHKKRTDNWASPRSLRNTSIGAAADLGSAIGPPKQLASRSQPQSVK